MKPDGYAVLIDDKESPFGNWFVGCYNDAALAEGVAAKTKGRVIPFYFSPSAGPACDALTWQPISDIGPMPTPHIIRGPGLLTAYMKHSGQWYRIDLPEHPESPATGDTDK